MLLVVAELAAPLLEEGTAGRLGKHQGPEYCVFTNCKADLHNSAVIKSAIACAAAGGGTLLRLPLIVAGARARSRPPSPPPVLDCFPPPGE